jgi:hypothetical protein
MERNGNGSEWRGMARGGLIVLLLVGAATCSSNLGEPQSVVHSPFERGITDDDFRSAGGCPDCSIAARSNVALPLTGKTFAQVKLVSASESRLAALDEHGNVVDPRALLAAEGAAKLARQGKLRDDAYARSLTSSSELVRVSIWADVRDEHAPRNQILANSTLRASHQAQTANRLRSATSKVTRWLDARGFRIYDLGIETPLITADVPASALTALGHLDGVALVHVMQPEVLAGFTWFDTVKGPAAHAIVSSVAGGLAYCNGEGWQPDDYTYLSPFQIFDSGALANSHTTWTSELVSATASTRMAPGASHHVASWSGSNKYNAWSWCYGLGIHNLNRSAGVGTGPMGPQADDMAQDYYVYHWPYPLITLAGGNCATSSGALIACNNSNNVRNVYVGNRGYNALVVGASDGNVTTQTSDDFLAVFSQYSNPITTNGDHELPNLVAPGDENTGYSGNNISSASTGNRGTSASAPIVLGTVLLMKTQDSSFDYWPEMTRATIMTASTRPVDGARTVRVDGGDKKHGAGLLNAAVAVELADPSYHSWGTNNPGMAAGRDSQCVDFSTDFPSGKFGPYNIATSINGRLRVVAAWDATAQGCDTTNGSGCTGVNIDGDLDLYVMRWTGSSWVPACWSTSYDSSWELCDLAVNAGETYKVELVKSSTNSTGTCLGIAWNNYNPSAE